MKTRSTVRRPSEPGDAPSKRGLGSLRGRLRVETQEIHEQLNCWPLVQRMLSGRHCKSDYCEFLQKTADYRLPLENAIKEHSRELRGVLEVEDHFLASEVKHDLHSLGLDSATKPSCEADIPVFDSAFEALGGLYVLAGSANGNRYIHRQLHSWIKDNGLADNYLGKSIEPVKWHSFCDAINGLDEESAEAQQVVDGAKATFKTIAGLVLVESDTGADTGS